MYQKIIGSLLIIVGLINFFPLIGSLSVENLNKLYSISVTDNNLIILMRHRAILFGLIGGFIIYAAFNRSYQMAAFLLGFTSMCSFIFIALQVENYNENLRRVIFIDWIAIGILSVALILYIISKYRIQ